MRRKSTHIATTTTTTTTTTTQDIMQANYLTTATTTTTATTITMAGKRDLHEVLETGGASIDLMEFHGIHTNTTRKAHKSSHRYHHYHHHGILRSKSYRYTDINTLLALAKVDCINNPLNMSASDKEIKLLPEYDDPLKESSGWDMKFCHKTNRWFYFSTIMKTKDHIYWERPYLNGDEYVKEFEINGVEKMRSRIHDKDVVRIVMSINTTLCIIYA